LATDDEAASLAALYLRNREAMLRAAYAILRHRHDAEDAVSTAIAKVAARLAHGHQVDDPDAYLLQAVRNAALDERRASARRRGSPLGDEPAHRRFAADAPDGLASEVPEKAPDIVDQVIERQRSADLLFAVRQTLDGLPAREAAMLQMLLAGQTRTEIGQRFNLTGQRVGQLLKKPIADLLDQLGIVPPPGSRQQRPTGQRS
jgi:RNA polymerase sigma factor (sigma-70 family)